MNFIAIVMTPSIVFRQKLRKNVRKDYCPVSIQMHLTNSRIPRIKDATFSGY